MSDIDTKTGTLVAGILIGLALGIGLMVVASSCARKGAQEQFNNLTPELQTQFLYDNLPLIDRREIAKDYCAINKQARDICGRARLAHPVVVVEPMDSK